jgi:hypothetical protein
MKNFIHDYHLNKYGLKKMAMEHTVKLLFSVMQHDKRATRLNIIENIDTHDRGTAARCSCGNHYLTDSVYCRKCGNHRPGFDEEKPPPVVAESTHDVCGCGNVFKGDSKFCRKCGRRRPQTLPDGKQCGCGNIFLTDSKYCRKCGVKRPGNTDAAPERSGSSTHLKCACKNEFAKDSLYCRKCGLQRPKEKPQLRFGIFLCAVGMKSKRFTSGPEAGELMCLMLRRAFSKQLKSMSEHLGVEAGQCLIPRELAVDMVIGPDPAKRHDSATWNAPQLWNVGTTKDIERLLKQVEGLEHHRVHGHGIVSF